jgi:hypothetical protein
MNLSWLAVDFAVTPFKTQLIYLRKTRLLVAAAGTAVHNMIFMNHSTSAIVIMMADWCRCSWQYVNQGILLGINVLTYCQPGDTENKVPVFHSTSNFWLQCSVVAQFSDLFVDIQRFTSDLYHIFNSTQRGDLQSLPSNPYPAPWCQVGRSFVDDRERFPLPQFMISKMNTTSRSGGFWKVKMLGELSSSRIPQNILQSFSSISFCYSASSKNVGSDMSFSSCFLINSQNYHSYYEIETSYPSVTIHSYGQISQHGGKIRDSDNYISIDLRVRDQISRVMPQIKLELGNELNCPSSNFHQLLCSIQGNEFKLCVGEILPDSSFEISLQPIVKKLCRSISNDTSFCSFLSSSLSHCVYKRVLETQLSLPHPQYQPIPTKPFVFLHIEKTAGTSIRG